MWKFICMFLLCAGLSLDVSAQDDKEKSNRASILKSLKDLDDSKAVKKYNESGCTLAPSSYLLIVGMLGLVSI